MVVTAREKRAGKTATVGVGSNREGQTTLPLPLFLHIFPALPLRVALHYLNAWTEQAICCMIDFTQRD